MESTAKVVQIETKLLTLDFKLNSSAFSALAQQLGSRDAAYMIHRLEFLYKKWGDGFFHNLWAEPQDAFYKQSVASWFPDMSRRTLFRLSDKVRVSREYLPGEKLDADAIDFEGFPYAVFYDRKGTARRLNWYRNAVKIDALVRQAQAASNQSRSAKMVLAPLENAAPLALDGHLLGTSDGTSDGTSLTSKNLELENLEPNKEQTLETQETLGNQKTVLSLQDVPDKTDRKVGKVETLTNDPMSIQKDIQTIGTLTNTPIGMKETVSTNETKDKTSTQLKFVEAPAQFLEGSKLNPLDEFYAALNASYDVFPAYSAKHKANANKLHRAFNTALATGYLPATTFSHFLTTVISNWSIYCKSPDTPWPTSERGDKTPTLVNFVQDDCLPVVTWYKAQLKRAQSTQVKQTKLGGGGSSTPQQKNAPIAVKSIPSFNKHEKNRPGYTYVGGLRYKFDGQEAPTYEDKWVELAKAGKTVEIESLIALIKKTAVDIAASEARVKSILGATA